MSRSQHVRRKMERQWIADRKAKQEADLKALRALREMTRAKAEEEL